MSRASHGHPGTATGTHLETGTGPEDAGQGHVHGHRRLAIHAPQAWGNFKNSAGIWTVSSFFFVSAESAQR